MPAEQETIWSKEPHTDAKHVILRKYLDAWIPILSSRNQVSSLIYLDGFAGPGEYIDKKTGKSEPGSPIIALEALRANEKFKGTMHFLFIEQDEKRCENLVKVLEPYKKIATAEIEDPLCGLFDEELSKRLDELENEIKILNEKTGQSYQRVPTFALIDPFGYKIPMSIIKRLMKSPKSEILVTLVIPSFKRFCSQSKNKYLYNELFATSEWKKICEMDSSQDKDKHIRELYVNQLKDYADIEHTFHFQMKNKFNQTSYFLIFGTNFWLGIEKMKESMWTVDSTGNYTFSDLSDPNQSTIMDFNDEDVIHSALRKELRRLKGKKLPIYNLRRPCIREFIALETPFPPKGLRKKVLKPMELSDPPEIKVHTHVNDRRPGTFPDRCKCLIEFL